MPISPQGLAACLGLAAMGAAAMCMAEIPPLRPGHLDELSTHVFTGKMGRIYSSVERASADWEIQHFVAEIHVKKVDKGAYDAPLAYVRYFQRRYTGKGPPPSGAYGHRDIPETGATTTVYVALAKDGGFDVLSPNGFVAPSAK